MQSDDHIKDDVLAFLDWAVESNSLDVFSSPQNTISTRVNLPEGWGSESEETLGVMIYFRGRKVLRSEVVALVEEWIRNRGG